MSAQFRDYYQTLGVSKTATPAEIKTAFRKLARQFHPDTAKDKKAAEEKFKEINEAYEVLGDAEKRKRYDEYGQNWQHGPPPGGGFRGGARGPGGGFRQAPRSAGSDEDFEFGGTGFSDFFEQMFAVINYRYMNNLPMLISSEKLIEDLIQIDEALGSRIYEMSKDYVIELIGKKLNYRMRDDNERDT